MQPDDTLALVLPNGVEMIAAYLAGTQIGCYVTPINHHLVGPEIAYIVSDSEAKVLIGHERFAERARPRSLAELGDAAAAGVRHRRRRPASGPSTSCSTASPTRRPPSRVAGAPMHYTSGTTGKPKGVKRGRVDMDPDDLVLALLAVPDPVRRAARRRQRPHHRLAAVPHRRAALDEQLAAPRATRSCSWTSGTPRRCCG